MSPKEIPYRKFFWFFPFKKRTEKLLTQTNSIIKIMITDFKSEGAVLGDPIVSSDFRIHKEEDRIRDRIALKANFSGYNRFIGRGVIDSAERYG